MTFYEMYEDNLFSRFNCTATFEGKNPDELERSSYLNLLLVLQSLRHLVANLVRQTHGGVAVFYKIWLKAFINSKLCLFVVFE